MIWMVYFIIYFIIKMEIVIKLYFNIEIAIFFNVNQIHMVIELWKKFKL